MPVAGESPVGSSVLAVILLCGVLVLGGVEARAADEGHVALDIYALSQADPSGGNPYRSEGFGYGACGVDMQIPLSEQYTMRANATLGLILNDDVAEFPATVSNAFVTSASPNVLTLDSGAWIDFIPSASSPWKFSPGLFYHHQDGFWAGGLDLAVRRSLFEDNSALLVSYSFRGAVDKQKRWDARPAQFDHQFSHTLLVSWTQYLSKSWVGNLGIQLAHQSGQLGSALNYVTVFDQDAIPRRLVDEDLPRRRSRMQLIGRVRYSPWVKYSIGMDASYYLDDWGIHHESMQPSVELPLVWDIRLRLWYRLALQQASTYFTSQPTNDDGFHTQDSDLGRFVMHNPGLFLNIPLREPSAGKLGWDTRLSAFGFYRDDDIYAIGANMGVVTRW